LNIVLAAADDFLEPLSAIREFMVTPVGGREDVIYAAETAGADVVVLSPELPGEMDIIDIVEELLDLNIRTVFLGGRLNPNNLTIKKLVELGVYDILFEPVTIGRLKDALINPAGEFQPNPGKPVIMLDEQDGNDTREGALNRIKSNLPQLAQRKIKGDGKVTGKGALVNLIGVCSPVPAGKTMVALNLAAVLALRGNSVALVDLDLTQLSLANWIEVPEGEDGVYRLLKDPGNALEHGYNPNLLPWLYIYTASNIESGAGGGKKAVGSVLKNLCGAFDFVIADTAADFKNAATQEVIASAGQVALVTDSDFNHLRKIQAVLDGMPEEFFTRCSLAANRVVNSELVVVSDAENAAGLKADVAIADCLGVLESIKAGIPAVLYREDLKHSFEEYADFLMVNIQESFDTVV